MWAGKTLVHSVIKFQNYFSDVKDRLANTTHPVIFHFRSPSQEPQVLGCRRRLFGGPSDLRVADSPWPGRTRSPGPHSARCPRDPVTMAPIQSPGAIAAASPDIFETSSPRGQTPASSPIYPSASRLGASGMDSPSLGLDDTGLDSSAAATSGPSLAGKNLNNLPTLAVIFTYPFFVCFQSFTAPPLRPLQLTRTRMDTTGFWRTPPGSSPSLAPSAWPPLSSAARPGSAAPPGGWWSHASSFLARSSSSWFSSAPSPAAAWSRPSEMPAVSRPPTPRPMMMMAQGPAPPPGTPASRRAERGSGAR